ncbi:hypothetical protein C808_00085 [Lachnospiraceae bacterium M18-1]|nr:hypothetical protein C808_00085 [Lachnospiraceae bacterium M18-1]
MAEPMKYCFQKSNGNVHKLYVYDDVRAYGDFNWSTWKFDESETSAKFFRDQLESIPDTDIIELHINSNGGSVKEGVAIYNQLKQKACHKVGYVDGVAYSIAFVILQACDERIMGIGTSALVHDMWIEACGNARELRKMADDLDVLMEANRKIFLEKSNLEEDQLTDMMERETFLTPDQCLAYGLIDKIGDYDTQEGQQADMEQKIQQMKELVTQQRAFKEQLAQLHQESVQVAAPQVPKMKLTNQLAKFFENM